MSKLKLLLLIVLAMFLFSGCSGDDDTVTMQVKASAYTSTVAQTTSTPFIGAWGDKLVPGQKSIAVSRDLISKGLGHNVVVKIEGLDGEYAVKDKMNKRWTDKIDIYMGLDTKAAKDWGKREVTITFKKPEPKK